MLTRCGCGWRAGLTSVIIDRAVWVAVLFAFAFIILLLPSTLNALSDYCDLTRFVFGGVLVFAALTLYSTPRMAPLLQRWRYSRWLGTLATDAHFVLLGRQAPTIFGAACLIHALTIVLIWSIGRAQGLALPVFDYAVLFTVMVGLALVPISVGGCGLREFAVVSLLGAHGIARAGFYFLGVLRIGRRGRRAAGADCLAPVSAATGYCKQRQTVSVIGVTAVGAVSIGGLRVGLRRWRNGLAVASVIWRTYWPIRACLRMRADARG
jgi:hypothetical protein